MKQEVKVLELVSECPSNCYEIAAELGISNKIASTVLSYLHDCGLVKRSHQTAPYGRKVWVYESV